MLSGFAVWLSGVLCMHCLLRRAVFVSDDALPVLVFPYRLPARVLCLTRMPCLCSIAFESAETQPALVQARPPENSMLSQAVCPQLPALQGSLVIYHPVSSADVACTFESSCTWHRTSTCCSRQSHAHHSNTLHVVVWMTGIHSRPRLDVM